MELLLKLVFLSGLFCLNSYIETDCVYDSTPKQQLKLVKFLKSRISYYHNSSASFQLDILIYGDINPNPGPAATQNTHDPSPGPENHVKTLYNRSELMSLRHACPTLPLYLQHHIASLRIPTKKLRITHRGKRRRSGKYAQPFASPHSFPQTTQKVQAIMY